jgi:hypothetical protein
MLGRVVLKPDLARAPIYDNIYRRGERLQSFRCLSCRCPIEVDFENFIGKPASVDAVLGKENGAMVRSHFGILDRSLENGWPKARVEVCAACGKRYLVYVAEFEPRNGWCQGVLQGITELVAV